MVRRLAIPFGTGPTIDKVVRVTDPETWTLRRGLADMLCWGVLPSGRLADTRRAIPPTSGG